MPRCEAKTLRGTRCTVEVNGNRWCHVHDPDGRFQKQQVARKKGEKMPDFQKPPRKRVVNS